jgi:hypothetical protein
MKVCCKHDSDLQKGIVKSSMAPDPEHEITIWEDQEEFQERDADGSAPMSESDSEDGMLTSPTFVNLRFH